MWGRVFFFWFFCSLLFWGWGRGDGCGLSFLMTSEVCESRQLGPT